MTGVLCTVYGAQVYFYIASTQFVVTGGNVVITANGCNCIDIYSQNVVNITKGVKI